MEASFWQTGLRWMDGSRAETQAVLVEIQLNDNDVNRIKEAPMGEDAQCRDSTKKKEKDTSNSNQKLE